MNAPDSLHGATRLTHAGLIRARGADAASFLHGQLTQDFAKLDGTQARLAGFCSAKGRLLASFVGWKAEEQDVLLACHASVLPATLKRLSMFVLRAQCKLSDASGEVAMWGLAGAPARELLGEVAVWGKKDVAGGAVVRLPDATGVTRALWAATQPPPAAPELPLDTWRWLAVHSGIPVIEAATAEQFVPQMVNFELVGGVNFQKGCYPGQEIVARSQYRGTAKRRMFLFDIDAPAQAGQEVFHSDDPGQPAGMVVNAAARPGAAGTSALVEVKLAALASGRLHLGSPEGPALAPCPLPYDVPMDAPATA
jgi:folate-binding protein YgfZ